MLRAPRTKKIKLLRVTLRIDERSGFLVRAAHPEDISSLAPLLRVFKYTPAVFCVSTLAAPVWFPVPSFEGGFERLVFPTA